MTLRSSQATSFEILNADKEDDDDEEIELDDEAVCDKDKEKSPQYCEAIPIPIAGPSKARLPRKSKQKVIFGSGYRAARRSRMGRTTRTSSRRSPRGGEGRVAE